MSKESPKNLIETKVMLLAAGGSAITQEFVTKLDESLEESGLPAVGLTVDAISFAEPLYESLEATTAGGDSSASSSDESSEKDAAASTDPSVATAFEMTILGHAIA